MHFFLHLCFDNGTQLLHCVINMMRLKDSSVSGGKQLHFLKNFPHFEHVRFV